jgi:hypothetical protein
VPKTKKQKRDEAIARQAEFDAHFDKNGEGYSRKEFGKLRHEERLAAPQVTLAGN